MPVLATMTSGLDTPALVAAVTRIDSRLDAIRERLNAADRVLGDGDTGMTIATVVRAWSTALRQADGDVGATLQSLGRATRDASGSSLASVIAMALMAAGKTLVGTTTADRQALVASMAAAERVVSSRSGATEGDKSFLDSLVAMRRAFEASHDEPLLDTALRASEAALEAFRPREARLGRARMYGAKSCGHDDPGMLAALELLRAAGAAH